MKKSFRWFATEEEETRLESSRSQSPFRQKRSVEILNYSSESDTERDDDKTVMSENENEMDQSQMLREILQSVRKNEKALESVNTSLNELKGDVHTLHTQNAKMKQEIDELRNENEYLHGKMNEIEHRVNLALELAGDTAQYSRRNNIKIFGIEEKKDENVNAILENVIKDRLKITDFKVADDVKAAHRVGPRATQPNAKPRTIIVRLRRRMRDRVVHAKKGVLKGTGIAVTEDLTRQTSNLYSVIKDQDIVEKAWTRDGRVMILVKQSGKITQVKSLQHLRQNASEWLKWVKPPQPLPPTGQQEDQQTDDGMQIDGEIAGENKDQS